MRVHSSIVAVTVAVALACITPLPAAALTVSGTFHIHDNVGPNSAGVSTGDRLAIGATTVNPSGAPTTVTATQGLTFQNLSFIPLSLFPELYNASRPFNAGLTGSWTITATRGADVAVTATNSIPSPQLVPLALNVHVEGFDLTPTVRWTLPDLAGFDIDRIRVRAWHDDVLVPGFASLNDLFFQSVPLEPDATEFEIPFGLLEKHRPYIFEVLIEDIGSTGQVFFIENRSRTFTQQPYEVPAPAALGLLGAGLLALGVAVRRRRPAA